MSTRELYYIARKEINDVLWNKRVEMAGGGLIYSTTEFLDSMSENWSAIVNKDYSLICAVPWKIKYGIKYIYTPPFIQQLGLIGDSTTDAEIQKVAHLLKYKFLYGDYFSNFRGIQGTATRSNYILQLDRPFEEIKLHYTSELRYNLKKAYNKLFYKPSDDFERPIDVFSESYSHRVTHIKNSDYNKLKALLSVLKRNGKMFIRKAVSNNHDHCTIICLKDRRRIYLLMTVVNPESRKFRPTHFLIDNIIKEFAGTKYTLDFEGSDLPGVRHFYKTFNPVNEPYFFYHWNRLPWPINKFK